MDHVSHSGQIRNTLLWHAMETTLVHFGALHGRPRDPSALNFDQVIKNIHPTHQEL